MTDTINGTSFAESIEFTLGSLTSLIPDVPSINQAFLTSVQDATSGVIYDYNTVINQLLLLAYAHEIWQRSAAKGMGTNSVSSGPVAGQGTMTDSGREFVRVTFDGNSVADGTRTIDGEEPIRDYGWFAFTYSGEQGQLQKITWKHAIFFPEVSNADGCIWFLKPGATGLFTGYTKDYNGIPMVGNSGSLINIQDNIVAGIDHGGSTVGSDTGSQVENVTFPTQDSSVTFQSHLFGELPHTTDFTSFVNNRQLLYLTFAYLVESWQRIATPWASLPAPVNHSVTGAMNSFLSDFAYSQSADLEVTSSANTPDEFFGPSGPRMFGYAASCHSGYFGRLQYVNAASNNFVPSGPDCTGWQFILKEAVSGNVNIWGTASRVQPIITPRGNIQIADGVTTGL